MPTNCKYTNLSASASVKAGAGTLYGIIVNSNTSGTLVLNDNTTATAPIIMNTFSFPSGSGVYTFPQGISFNTGLYATIGGTADITILWT